MRRLKTRFVTLKDISNDWVSQNCFWVLIILCYQIFNFSDTLEDAERIKTEQAKRIETLERDLKIGAVDTVKPASESKQTIVCQSFSDDNKDVTVSNGKRSVKHNRGSYGYCFLNHPKMQKNQILKWSPRVPKDKFCSLGMVIMPE